MSAVHASTTDLVMLHKDLHENEIALATMTHGDLSGYGEDVLVVLAAEALLAWSIAKQQSPITVGFRRRVRRDLIAASQWVGGSIRRELMSRGLSGMDVAERVTYVAQRMVRS